jgi:hypothetical protein
LVDQMDLVELAAKEEMAEAVLFIAEVEPTGRTDTRLLMVQLGPAGNNRHVTFKHNGQPFSAENIRFLIEQISSKDRKKDESGGRREPEEIQRASSPLASPASREQGARCVQPRSGATTTNSSARPPQAQAVDTRGGRADHCEEPSHRPQAEQGATPVDAGDPDCESDNLVQHDDCLRTAGPCPDSGAAFLILQLWLADCPTKEPIVGNVRLRPPKGKLTGPRDDELLVQRPKERIGTQRPKWNGKTCSRSFLA